MIVARLTQVKRCGIGVYRESDELKMKWHSRALIAVLSISIMVLGLLAACGQKEEVIPEPEETVAEPGPTEAVPVEHETAESSEEGQLRVALVLVGSISDGSFNSMAYEGLMAIKEELGLEVAYAESVPVAEFEETYRGFGEEGYDIIIGHGFEFGEPAAMIAPQYLDVYYLVTNGNASGPNVASLEPLFEEAGYLVGALAGLMTTTNRVGAVGGMEFPIIVRGIEAYGAGA